MNSKLFQFGLLYFTVRISGHSAVVIPRPRQALDGVLAPWNGTVPFPVPFDWWCATPSADAVGQQYNLTGSNGQACFWFSNGCDISCDQCDGTSGQTLTPSYIYTGNGTVSAYGGEDIVPDPTNPITKRALCGQPKRNATICDPALRTVNTNAECGSPEDVFYYAPWRYPGSAPVIDACGTAGGRWPGQGQGRDHATYRNTTLSKLGDLGSKLPPAPSGTTWTEGSHVEVSWTQTAFHGGGYQYRLCPADQELTEECFQKTPLQFVGQSSLRWGGVGGEQIWFNATDVSEGTIPTGSTWRKTPLPRGPYGWMGRAGGGSFEPKCDEPPECRNAHEQPPPPMLTCRCSGDYFGDIPNLEVVDKLLIPDHITPGKWVLGWRFDCEEAKQVFSSCSDVTIEGKKQTKDRPKVRRIGKFYSKLFDYSKQLGYNLQPWQQPPTHDEFAHAYD